ncbi:MULTISPECIES: hypothetical protein [unclassified Streptomyces]|uniref:hypothetical protein n=1 Tax=unclassified Streptomyces TaxID=2593676 RepID=UPI0008DE3C4D|nr:MULTISPECIES: hypothetical protein [unclassified Streptomyces]OII67530.1 hypothetical protein BJP39_24690 [Streptomyces sp. CC77]
MTETAEPGTDVRVLPGARSGDKTCILITDGGSGPLSRHADALETIRLEHAAHTLARARSLPPSASATELRTFLQHLTDHLEEVLLVARSRGRRPRP